MKTQWIVTLHEDDGYGVESQLVLCGCDTFRAAQVAGQMAQKYYSGHQEGTYVHMECHNFPSFWYTVREHRGEWI